MMVAVLKKAKLLFCVLLVLAGMRLSVAATTNSVEMLVPEWDSGDMFSQTSGVEFSSTTLYVWHAKCYIEGIYGGIAQITRFALGSGTPGRGKTERPKLDVLGYVPDLNSFIGRTKENQITVLSEQMLVKWTSKALPALPMWIAFDREFGLVVTLGSGDVVSVRGNAVDYLVRAPGASWLHHTAFAFSPEARLVALGWNDGPLRVADLRTSSVVESADVRGFSELFFVDHGESLMVGGWDGSIKILNSRTLALQQTLRFHRGRVSGFASLSDDRFISASWDGSFVVWRRTHAGGWEVEAQARHRGGVDSITVSPDRLWCCAVGRHRIYLYRIGRFAAERK